MSEIPRSTIYTIFGRDERETDFISRLRKVVEEINKYEEPLYDVHWDTGYEDGKNEAIKIIRSAFPELKTLDEMLDEVTDENKHKLEEK